MGTGEGGGKNRGARTTIFSIFAWVARATAAAHLSKAKQAERMNVALQRVRMHARAVNVDAERKRDVRKGRLPTVC